MLKQTGRLALAAVVGLGLAAGAGAAKAQTPKSGGVLNLVVGSNIPSFDGHQETTFGMIHPIRPFYSLIIRVNPNNPSDPTDFECDLCEGAVPEPTEGGTKYTFNLRKGVTFHDGTPFTSADAKATMDKIIFPPEGVPSARKAFFRAVESITTPDDHTIVFKLKFPTAAFIPALATPFNFVYAKKDLDAHGMEWHKANVNGTGPFKFVQYQPGAFVEGVRNENYHLEGRPYLDGFKAIAAPKMAVRLQAIRGDRAAIEFRGFPPKARDDLVKALGDQDHRAGKSDWNCVLHGHAEPEGRKPFDDQACASARSPWVSIAGVARSTCQNIAIVKTVGGVVFPNHPLAASEEELVQIEGLRQGHRGLPRRGEEAPRRGRAVGPARPSSCTNRGVDQPYKRGGHLAHRPVEVRSASRLHPAGAAHRSVLRHAAQEEGLPGLPRLQLPVGGEPAG